MKTVLVPVEAGEQLDSVFNGALLLARRLDCYVEGIPVGATFEGLVTYEGPIVAEALTRPEDQPSADELGALFTSFMQRNGVAPVDKPEPRLSYRWAGGDLAHESFIGNHSRLFDVAVVGRPRREGGSPSITITESVLFEGGRPVLVVPPGMSADASFGKSMLIAWNCSTESARAVSAAIPLLKLAERVLVLTVEGGTIPGPSGQQLRDSLGAHGIRAEELTVKRDPAGPGPAILAQASVWSADLIVKGAYTNSRLRQMIFGGATRHLLHHAELPVVMAN
jgi:nucleotide-binding universal stress UspA family protein